MKKFVAFVSPVPDEETTAVPAGPDVVETRSGDAAAEDPSHGALRIEAVLSDDQAQRILSALLNGHTADDAQLMIEEFVRRELETAGPAAGNLFERIVIAVERELFQRVYLNCERVKKKAAARLGINRNTLHKKLEQYAATNGKADATQVPTEESASAED
jgi:DNA-binding protein Fis